MNIHNPTAYHHLVCISRRLATLRPPSMTNNATTWHPIEHFEQRHVLNIQMSLTCPPIIYRFTVIHLVI